MKTYSGPVSDHFNGRHFFDPDGTPPLFWEMLRWQFDGSRKRHKWPEWAPSPYSDKPPPRVDGDKVRFAFVGHASWLIQTAGLNILVDPVWSERASPFSFAGPKRHNDPGIAFEALPSIDAVLVSHGHYDHLDVATLSRLAARFSPRVVTPLGNDLVMRAADGAIRAEAFDWHDCVELGTGRHAACSTATALCGRASCWRRPAASSTSSAIQAMAPACTSGACARCMGRCARRFCPSELTSRAGS
jgi:hypothetical protein